MDPISLGISISAVARHVFNKIDWGKVGESLAKEGASASGKTLWKWLKPSDKERAVKLAVALFIEQFNVELEDKTPLSSALLGYQDQLKRLVEATAHEIAEWMQPETTEVDLGPVKRIWEGLHLDPLPEGFDWQFVSRSFAREIRKTVKGDPNLREQLSIALQEQIAEFDRRTADATERIAGPAPGFDLDGYRNFLRNRCVGLHLAVMHPSTYAFDRQPNLWNIFVPQLARASVQTPQLPEAVLRQLRDKSHIPDSIEEDEGIQKGFQDPVAPILETADRERLIVVLGDPGSGKTSLLNFLALKWVEEARGPLPLRVDLKQYVLQRIGITKYLEQGHATFRLDATTVERMLQSGEAALHLDGLDEVFHLPTRDVVIEEIAAIATRYSKASIIVTSRILGYEPERLRNARFWHAILKELDDDQIAEFIRLWHEVAETDPKERSRLRERLQIAISDSRPIRDLAGNPLLLTMMAILNRTQPLPRNRFELYREASRVLLHEWDTRRLLPDDTLDQQDKVKILRDLAGHMQQEKHGLAVNLVDRDTLVQLFREFLKKVSIANPYEMSKLLVTQLTERNFILCYAGADRFCFVHRTFLEYFCAVWFVHRFQVDQSLSLLDLRDQVFGGHWRDETWHEVLCLIAGMVGEKNAEQLIVFLMAQDGRGEKQSNLRIAARCMSELRNRQRVEDTDAALYQRILQDVMRYEPPYYLELEEEEAECRPVREQAVTILATVWRSATTALWLRQTLQSDRDWIVRQAAVRELATGWKDDPETHLLLLDCACNEEEWGTVRGRALQELARGWKDDPDTRPWLFDRARNDKDGEVRRTAVMELANGWKDDSETLPLLVDRSINDRDESVRKAVVREWGQRWKENPEIRLLLLDRVRNDAKDVRGAAVQELVRGWKGDPETRTWLIDLAHNDRDQYVRLTAVQELVRGWKDDPETRTWLLDLVRKDKDKHVRQTAVQELVRGWKEDPEIRRWLLDLSRNDRDEGARETAIHELAHGWKDDPETRRLLFDRAANDEDWYVRIGAIKELVRGWKDDPETRRLLFDRAASDEDWSVRRAVLEELACGWHDDSETRSLLQDRASNDSNALVRGRAVRELGRVLKEDPNTYSWLIDIARNDRNGEVRCDAMRELAHGWRDSPATHSLLLDRARNDEAPDVQRVAVVELGRGWRG